jgi:polyphosphate kinase
MSTNLHVLDQAGVTAGAKTKLALASPEPVAEKLLFNRELSLIEFFRQVLEEGLEVENPLLERLRYLTIFSNIVDEFFMVRVSGLKEEIEHGWLQPSPDGMTADEQLRQIRDKLRPMIVEQMRCLKEEILPALADEGIVLTSYQSLSHEQRAELDRYFEDHVLPVLTPMAVDPAHPFPYISGLSLNLGVMVESQDKLKSISKSEARFVRIKVPPVLPGLIPIEKGSKFVFLSEVIAANLGALFPGMQAGHSYPFRVTRDADIEIRDDEADDLLRALQQELRKRRFGTPVRLEASTEMPDAMLDYLTNSLGLESDDVYPIDGPLNLTDLLGWCDLNRPDLKFRPLRPSVPKELRGGRPIFDVIKEHDVLLHHPYTAYSTVTDFIRSAANDPEVLAIKICLYRTGPQSAIADALIAAGEQGKQVTAVIELKARFDEQNNIEWAQRLERAGVHVVYGLVGLKTHCKLSLVIRREGDMLRRYVHIATGNYTPTSSSTYTDLGLLTADKEIGADATELFNYLTGYSQQKEYRRLLIAPVNLREQVTALIERETANAKAGRSARIIAKLNRLADPNIIQALYDASAAGVEIDLIVRGICMLRPGVPGLSEHIRVRSIIGRFLEHSRILQFANDGNEEIYIGSADWMPRNLNRRVEVICPIKDSRLKEYLRDEVLQAYLRDNTNARELQPDGSYRLVEPSTGDRFDSQMYFENAAL